MNNILDLLQIEYENKNYENIYILFYLMSNELKIKYLFHIQKLILSCKNKRIDDLCADISCLAGSYMFNIKDKPSILDSDEEIDSWNRLVESANLKTFKALSKYKLLYLDELEDIRDVIFDSGLYLLKQD